MRQWLACLATITVLVSACSADELVPPEAPWPIFHAPAAVPVKAAPPPTQAGDDIVLPDPLGTSSLSTVSPLPPRPPLNPMTPPSVSFPVGAEPNVGPITGYGPGGMGHLFGSPPNVPYHYH